MAIATSTERELSLTYEYFTVDVWRIKEPQYTLLHINTQPCLLVISSSPLYAASESLTTVGSHPRKDRAKARR